MSSIPWKRLVDYLAEVGSERDLWSLCWRALTALERLVPCDGGVLQLTNNAREILPGSRCYRYPDSALGEYVEHYQYEDPNKRALPPGVRAAGASWVRDAGHSAFVDDYLLPLGIRSSGGLFLYDAAGRLFAFVNVHRSSARGFSAEEIATLEVAQSHVTNLVAGYTATGALETYTPVELEETHRLLSPREIEVARMVCRRLTASQIASILRISTRTVEQHIRSVYRKLDVHGKEELLRLLLPRSHDGAVARGA